MKVVFFVVSALLASASAMADSNSSPRAGWSCDVKTGPAGVTTVAHLDLFGPKDSFLPATIDQKIGGSYYVRFEVSSSSGGSDGQYYTDLFVNVMNHRPVIGDSRLVTTSARYLGPVVKNIDSLNPSNLFLVVNPPVDVQIECRPTFQE